MSRGEAEDAREASDWRIITELKHVVAELASNLQRLDVQKQSVNTPL
ncbi:MAG: hypothetical protein WBR26_08640 [Candidatus Acidiferrum sp.]